MAENADDGRKIGGRHSAGDVQVPGCDSHGHRGVRTRSLYENPATAHEDYILTHPVVQSIVGGASALASSVGGRCAPAQPANSATPSK
jgi:hypothetical protein